MDFTSYLKHLNLEHYGIVFDSYGIDSLEKLQDLSDDEWNFFCIPSEDRQRLLGVDDNNSIVNQLGDPVTYTSQISASSTSDNTSIKDTPDPAPTDARRNTQPLDSSSQKEDRFEGSADSLSEVEEYYSQSFPEIPSLSGSDTTWDDKNPPRVKPLPLPKRSIVTSAKKKPLPEPKRAASALVRSQTASVGMSSHKDPEPPSSDPDPAPLSPPPEAATSPPLRKTPSIGSLTPSYTSTLMGLICSDDFLSDQISITFLQDQLEQAEKKNHPDNPSKDPDADNEFLVNKPGLRSGKINKNFIGDRYRTESQPLLPDLEKVPKSLERLDSRDKGKGKLGSDYVALASQQPSRPSREPPPVGVQFNGVLVFPRNRKLKFHQKRRSPMEPPPRPPSTKKVELSASNPVEHPRSALETSKKEKKNQKNTNNTINGSGHRDENVLPDELRWISQYVLGVAIALYHNEDADTEELFFYENDKIRVTGMDDESGWWYGEARGKLGYFPGNFVKFISYSTPQVAEMMTKKETKEKNV